MMVSQYLTSHRIFKRPATALIRLRVCAGWSEALLVTHITLLEISSRSSNFNAYYNVKQLRNMQACAYASNASICLSVFLSVCPSVCLSFRLTLSNFVYTISEDPALPSYTEGSRIFEQTDPKLAYYISLGS